MGKGTKYALILGAIPFITLVFALPLVNRIKPMILGLPFFSPVNWSISLSLVIMVSASFSLELFWDYFGSV